VELRDALGDQEDLVVLYVMAEEQIDAKALRFLDEQGLREQVRFLADPGSRVISRLGLRKDDGEPIESGVAHPATYLLDRQGRVQLMDVRRDYQRWLDPGLVRAALAGLD